MYYRNMNSVTGTEAGSTNGLHLSKWTTPRMEHANLAALQSNESSGVGVIFIATKHID